MPSALPRPASPGATTSLPTPPIGVLEGGLTHDGDPVLARHVGHCVAKETPYGVIVTKDAADSPRKIDAAVAAIVAYDRAAWHAANSRPRVFVVGVA